MTDLCLAAEIETELKDNILPFWRGRALDRTGGFIGQMDALGNVVSNAPHGLILSSRLLWTFSAVYRWSRNEQDLQLAERAYEFLQTYFRDLTHGGYYWQIRAARQVSHDVKKVYGQAFCVYALSEYCLATGDQQARDAAIELFERIEQHALDQHHGGYFEVCHANWTRAENQQLSEVDQIAPKSMNTQLHVLEAYTNLCRIWPDAGPRQRLDQLLAIFMRHVLNNDRTHLHHFFAEDWTVRSDNYTYGHDIEASWLLCEAAEILHATPLTKSVAAVAAALAEATFREGMSPDGSLLNEGRAGEPTDRSRIWWVQAEGVVGFLNAFELTGNTRYLDATRRVWRYIQQQVVDRKQGEWHWRLDPEGHPDLTLPKVSIWKGPYHNGRMCLEVLRRTTQPHGDPATTKGNP